MGRELYHHPRIQLQWQAGLLAPGSSHPRCLPGIASGNRGRGYFPVTVAGPLRNFT